MNYPLHIWKAARGSRGELVKSEDSAFMNDLEALEIGLENEYAAYNFYMRVADKVDDNKTRNLLHELVVE